jgi:hypothetical protein
MLIRVLVKGVIYELHRWDGLKWHDICTKFHEDWFRNSGNIKVITSAICETAVLVLLMGRIYDISRYDDLKWHDIVYPSFMPIGSGIHVILRVLPQKSERL